MKLAFVTLRFAPEGVVGGAETLIRDLAEIAAGAGHEAHLLTTCAVDHHTWENVLEPGEREVDGLTVHFFPVDEGRDLVRFTRHQDRVVKGESLSTEDQEAWAANSVVSKALTDWLSAHGASFDAILAGPYLFGLILHASRIHPEKTWLIPCLHDEPYARVPILAGMFRSVKGCLFNSGPEKNLAERLYGLDPEKGRVVGMSLEPFDADPEAFAARHGIHVPYVLYCGRQEGGKNTPLLLEYMNTYIERRSGAVKLVLTGSGDVPPPDALRPHLMNLGFVDREEKHEAMAGASVFIHPSVNESFGIVLLEAWLGRAPALVHDRGEVLRWQCRTAGAGLWFRDYPDFEAMLDRLLEDPDLNRTLGENGRSHVLNTYTRRAVSDRLLGALETTS